MKKVWTQIRPASESFIATWAILRFTEISTTNIISVFLFTIMWLAIKSLDTIPAKGKTALLWLSAVFAAAFTYGSRAKICGALDNRLFCLAVLCISFLGYMIIFFKVLKIFYVLLEKVNLCNGKKMDSRLVFLTIPICFFCWLPYLLMNFPGIMTVDSMNQFAQVIGIWEDSNHHPWIHTQIMKGFYILGYYLTNDRTSAVAFFTVFQMLFMATCNAYAMKTLQTLNVNRWVGYITLFFFALLPYNAIYAVTIWKDTMFSGVVLVFSCILIRIILREREESVLKPGALYFISAILMCLMRSNGFYAFLFLTPFLLYSFRKYIKTFLPAEIAIIAIVFLIRGPVMYAFHVVQPDFLESLAIPTQQVSKVIMDGHELTEKQNAYLNRIMDVSEIPELYNPEVADGFKKNVRNYNAVYFELHKGEFFKLWLELMVKYPDDYITAFFDQTVGYWYPEHTELVGADAGVILNEFGVENRPILKGKIWIKYQEVILKLKNIIPGYGLFFSMGCIFWWMVVALVYLRVSDKRDKRFQLVYIPGMAIWLTLMIATPVARDFRYAYGYILCLPIYIICCMTYKENE